MYFLTFHPPTLTPTCALPAGGPIAWSMVGGHSASAPYPPGGQSREPHCTADRGESKCPPRPQPADQPILGCQGTGQESACTWPAVPSWGSDSCLPWACSESQGLTPAVLSTGSLTALQGRDWPHFQMWKTRGHLAEAQDSVEGEAWPPGPRPLPNPLLHHEGPPALSWGQGPENGIPCAHSSLKVILSRKQRARGSPVGRPSHTHGWHVPLPAHSPQRPQRAGAPCYKLGAD